MTQLDIMMHKYSKSVAKCIRLKGCSEQFAYLPAFQILRKIINILTQPINFLSLSLNSCYPGYFREIKQKNPLLI